MKSRFWLLALFFAAFFARSAPTGYCVPDNGVYHNNFQFNKQLSWTSSSVGMFEDIMIDNGTLSFKGTCYCLTGKNETYKYAYITSIVNPSLKPTAVRRNVHFYDLNAQLDIGLIVYVLGKGYVSVPFDHMPNDTGGTTDAMTASVQPPPFTAAARVLSIYTSKGILRASSIYRERLWLISMPLSILLPFRMK